MISLKPKCCCVCDRLSEFVVEKIARGYSLDLCYECMVNGLKDELLFGETLKISQSTNHSYRPVKLLGTQYLRKAADSHAELWECPRKDAAYRFYCRTRCYFP